MTEPERYRKTETENQKETERRKGGCILLLPQVRRHIASLLPSLLVGTVTRERNIDSFSSGRRVNHIIRRACGMRPMYWKGIFLKNIPLAEIE